MSSVFHLATLLIFYVLHETLSHPKLMNSAIWIPSFFPSSYTCTCPEHFRVTFVACVASLFTVWTTEQQILGLIHHYLSSAWGVYSPPKHLVLVLLRWVIPKQWTDSHSSLLCKGVKNIQILERCSFVSPDTLCWYKNLVNLSLQSMLWVVIPTTKIPSLIKRFNFF